MIKPIQKSVEINASKEAVWNVLFDVNNYPKWAGAFSEGSRAEVADDWKEGTGVVFSSGDESMGLAGTIKTNKPLEYMEISYLGMLSNGKIDTESEGAKSMVGARESYTLTEKDGVTLLNIYSDMDEQYYDMMSAAWDEAFATIKKLAEKK
ncbi:MAG: SRPBCC family protein [Candidatus Gracilibacteria bacterium]